jgi:ribosomal 30S subunit maturation factor RimM
MRTFATLITAAVALGGCATQAAYDVDDLVEADDDARIGGYLVDDIETMDLYDTRGRKIGEVQDVLATRRGRIVAVEVDVDGDEFILPIDEVLVTEVEPALVLRRDREISALR